MTNLKEIRSILITGGTGTFGKNFTKLLLKNYPNIDRIVIFSRDEFKQYNMSLMSPFKENAHRLRFFIGDVRDKDRLDRAFNDVDFIVHAAALKHVPVCEYNPSEAIKTNVIGAMNVIDIAIKHKIKKIIALSTDKACSPINLYGATKLSSDKLFTAANNYTNYHDPIFSVVRYGNVIGSRGSVLGYFQKLSRENAPYFPITHLEMTRFWLYIEDACQMVADAFNLMQGSEIFVKKTPSIKITGLATAINPHIKHKVVGIRPGEKIHEKMISISDGISTYEQEKYYTIYPMGDNNYVQKKGQKINKDFAYSSGTNPHFLTIKEIQTQLKDFNE